MANVKITDLTAYTDPVSTDVLPIVDVGADVTKKVSIADLLKNASAGTAAAPGIAFDGDNTGIYSPGADQVAISTNGTGALFINSSGRIGIGGATAAAPLQINSSNGNVYTLFDDGTNARVQIQADTNKTTLASFTTGAAEFEDIELRAAQHIFSRSGSSESARIDSSGRLLVGTSSDSGGALLQVNGNRIRVATAKTPSSASDTGTAGEICWDADYIYVCTATNTWKRTAISTW